MNATLLRAAAAARRLASDSGRSIETDELRQQIEQLQRQVDRLTRSLAAGRSSNSSEALQRRLREKLVSDPELQRVYVEAVERAAEAVRHELDLELHAATRAYLDGWIRSIDVGGSLSRARLAAIEAAALQGPAIDWASISQDAAAALRTAKGERGFG